MAVLRAIEEERKGPKATVPVTPHNVFLEVGVDVGVGVGVGVGVNIGICVGAGAGAGIGVSVGIGIGVGASIGVDGGVRKVVVKEFVDYHFTPMKILHSHITVVMNTHRVEIARHHPFGVRGWLFLVCERLAPVAYYYLLSRSKIVQRYLFKGWRRSLDHQLWWYWWYCAAFPLSNEWVGPFPLEVLDTKVEQM